MKRIYLLFFVFVLVLSLASCSYKSKETEPITETAELFTLKTGCEKMKENEMECQLVKYIGSDVEFSITETEDFKEPIKVPIDDKVTVVFLKKMPMVDVYLCENSNFESDECKVYQHTGLIDGWSFEPTPQYTDVVQIQTENKPLFIYIPKRQDTSNINTFIDKDGYIHIEE